jgi:hypothetical protein
MYHTWKFRRNAWLLFDKYGWWFDDQDNTWNHSVIDGWFKYVPGNDKVPPHWYYCYTVKLYTKEMKIDTIDQLEKQLKNLFCY